MVFNGAPSFVLAFVLPQISFISVGSVVMAYGETSPHFTDTGGALQPAHSILDLMVPSLLLLLPLQ